MVFAGKGPEGEKTPITSKAITRAEHLPDRNFFANWDLKLSRDDANE